MEGPINTIQKAFYHGGDKIKKPVGVFGKPVDGRFEPRPYIKYFT